MKRNLSSFDIFVMNSELQEYIDYNIEKIYHISKDEILIKIKNIKTKNKESIYIKNNGFIAITKNQLETPKKPTTFAMTLRKYLANGKIVNISQYEFDRIIQIKIQKKDIEYILIIELLSKGNVILLNKDNKIILPLTTQHWSHRTIKTNELYKYPPSQIDPFKLNFDEFSQLLKQSNSDLVRTLAVNINLSGLIAEEICENIKINKNKQIKNINQEEIKKIYQELKKFLDIFLKKKFSPVLVKKESEIIDILPFKFKSYQKIQYINIDNFIKSFEKFIIYDKKINIINKKNVETIEKYKRRINQQEETIEKLKKKIKEKKIEGELIYLNYNRCEEIIKEISKLFEFKNKDNQIKKIREKDIIKDFEPTNNKLILNLKDINGNNNIIKIDFRKTTAENAEKAYNDNKKLKIKLKGAENSLEKTKNELRDAINKNLKINQKNEKKSTEKTFWFENYRWLISLDGNIIVAGKDVKSNERIVKKYLKTGDRYAHADITGAPSCIIKNIDINNKTIPINESTLKDACNFCAYYSKAWNQYSEVQSYWVLPEQVSKTPQSGEYVPKGAFIIRGKRNYYKCILQMGIGEINLNNIKKIMAGPIDNIKNQSKKYVIIKPGNTKKNIIAGILAKKFKTSTDVIMKILPPGNITIVDSFGLNFDPKEII